MSPRILVVDDEENIRYVFKEFLSAEGHEVTAVENLMSAAAAIEAGSFDLIFVDILLGKHSGIELLGKVKEKGLRCPVVVMTGQPNLETAAASVRLGAFDYLSKPVLKDALLRVSALALEHKALIDERERLIAEKERYRRNLETIFRNVRDGIVTVNSSMEVIEANQSIETICGPFLNHAVGKPVCSGSGGCSRICCDVLKETIVERKAVREYRIVCGHEKRRDQTVVLSTSPMKDEHGAFIGAVMVIRDITRLTDLENELQERHRYQSIIGRNRSMLDLYRLIEDLAGTDSTVLITGESGTGKELVADAIHYGGARAYKPLIKVNCCALSENLLESELFGHVKGAFTGAIRDKRGRFELADGGTILLDEIGDIPARIQLKLLRVLQEKEVERVGDSRPIKVDVRILTSTNCNLKEKVRRGEFREDLYFRLNVVEVRLSPLRDRSEDIPLLLDHFRSLLNKRFKKNVEGVSDDVMRLFMTYSWPGNVRELEHAMEHAFVLCHGRILQMEHLPAEFQAQAKDSAPASGAGEKQALLSALNRAGWNKAKASRLLNMSRQTLYRKMKEFEIPETENAG